MGDVSNYGVIVKGMYSDWEYAQRDILTSKQARELVRLTHFEIKHGAIVNILADYVLLMPSNEDIGIVKGMFTLRNLAAYFYKNFELQEDGTIKGEAI